MKKILFTPLVFMMSITSFSQIYEWTKSMDANSTAWSKSVILDNNDNVINVGHFNSTVDFDPNAGTYQLSSSGGQDIFVQKLDVNGNLDWVHSFGSSSANSVANSVDVDASGNIYVTGNFAETIDFDPSINVQSLTPNGSDMFVLKLNSNGDFIWVKHLSSTSNSYSNSIKVEANGDVYIGGGYRNTMDFDPGIGVSNLTSNGNLDAFILKLNTLGEYQWAKSFGGNLIDEVNSLSTNGGGNVIATGWFEGTGNYNPDGGILNLTSIDAHDIFIINLNFDGSLSWAKSYGGLGDQKGESITMNSTGDIIVTGFYENTVDFNPNAGVYNLTGSATRNMFVQKLTGAGSFLWAKTTVGGTTVVYGNAVDLDMFDNIYLTGRFSNTVDFDLGMGTSYLTVQSVSDGYILKLDTDGNYIEVYQMDGNSTGQATPEDIYVSNYGDIYTCGIFSGTVDFDPSANIDNLTATTNINAFVQKLATCTNHVQLNESICDGDSYQLGTQSLSSAGQFIETFQNQAGCDSIVNLNLTILQTNTSTYNDTICEDDPYVFGTQTLYTGGQFVEIFQNQAGCDSVVTLNLYAEVLPIANITMVGNDLQANMGGNTYQWYFNGTAINGETNQIHTPTQNGDYTVDVISQRGCTKTSILFTVEGLGLNTNNINFSVSPNPSNGVFTIKSDAKFIYKVYNALGELTIESKSNQINLSTYKTGIYFLKVETTNGTVKTIKLIKQ